MVEKEPLAVTVDKRAAKEIVTPNEYAFPEEYAVAGWFKWTPIA